MWSHIHIQHQDTSTKVEGEKDHSTEADREKVCVHIQLHSQIDRLFFFTLQKRIPMGI
jgi:hypothetical protein